MATPITVSRNELVRLGACAYNGKAIRCSLALKGVAAVTAESSTAAWDALKCTAPGYADVSTTLGTGSFDTGFDLRWEAGQGVGADLFVTASFYATGSPYNFDTFYVVIDNSANIYGIIPESGTSQVVPGFPKTYMFQIALKQV